MIKSPDELKDSDMAKEKVSITLHPELLADVDWLANELDLTRTEMISWALCYALDIPAANQHEDDWMQVIKREFTSGRMRDLQRARAEQLHEEEMVRRFGGEPE